MPFSLVLMMTIILVHGLQETEKLEDKVDKKEGKAIKGEVNVRNYPAIHEETKRMEEETARKVDQWTTTAGQRKAAYDG